MTSGKEVPQAQLEFLPESHGKESSFSIPKRVPEEYYSLISKRKLWRERPLTGRAALYFDLEEQIYGIFNPTSLQITERIEPGSVARREINAMLLVVPSPTSENFHKIEDLLKKGVLLLKYSAPVTVIEQNEQNINETGIKTREAILKNAGLASVSALVRPQGGYLIWEAKVKGQRVVKPVNLIEEGRPKEKLAFYGRLLKDMVEEYKSHGFELVKSEDSAILKRLKASRNHLETISSLKLGFGVTVENVNCGCTYEIDLKGAETTIWSCKQNHDGPPSLSFEKPDEREPQRKEYILGEHEIQKVCLECGNRLVRTVIELKRRGGVTKIGIQDVCSSDGMADYKEEEILTSQITLPS